MYIMTDRGWQPLWSLSEVKVDPVDLGPISGLFKDYDTDGEFIGERHAIETARKVFHTEEKAKIVGLREAWDAKRQAKPVLFGVAKGYGDKKLYLDYAGLDADDARWVYGWMNGSYSDNLAHIDAVATKTGGYVTVLECDGDVAVDAYGMLSGSKVDSSLAKAIAAIMEVV